MDDADAGNAVGGADDADAGNEEGARMTQMRATRIFADFLVFGGRPKSFRWAVFCTPSFGLSSFLPQPHQPINPINPSTI